MAKAERSSLYGSYSTLSGEGLYRKQLISRFKTNTPCFFFSHFYYAQLEVKFVRPVLSKIIA